MPNDFLPNCAITLYFYAGDPKTATPPNFSYTCTHSSLGWRVQTNGSIHPPSQSRIVQIRLDAYPVLLERPPRFAGFRMGLMSVPQDDADTYWTPDGELSRLGVRMLTPGYPTKKSTTWETFGPLTFDLTEARERFVYSLAVSIGESGPVWDDPKIYDDGSQ
jgi:hypothetical protein